MNARRDPDRLIHAFLMDGQTELADQVYDAVRSGIERRRQRVFIGPWRTPVMNKLVPIGLGVAAVVGVLFLGSQFIGTPNGGIGGPSGAPTATAQPTATLDPTVTPAVPTPTGPSAPPLTETFTSTQHGISLSYPEGWTAEAATEPWTDGTYSLVFDPRTPYIDYLFDPILTDHLFLNMASQPIGDATPEEWMAAQDEECTATEPIEVDGATGLIGGDGCDLAVVTVGGRGYLIHLYTSRDFSAAVAPYDRAWFEEVLGTVELHPEDAVDVAASAAP